MIFSANHFVLRFVHAFIPRAVVVLVNPGDQPFAVDRQNHANMSPEILPTALDGDAAVGSHDIIFATTDPHLFHHCPVVCESDRLQGLLSALRQIQTSTDDYLGMACEWLVAVQESLLQPKHCIVAFAADVKGVIEPLDIPMIHCKKVLLGDIRVELLSEASEEGVRDLLDLLRPAVGIHASPLYRYDDVSYCCRCREDRFESRWDEWIRTDWTLIYNTFASCSSSCSMSEAVLVIRRCVSLHFKRLWAVSHRYRASLVNVATLALVRLKYSGRIGVQSIGLTFHTFPLPLPSPCLQAMVLHDEGAPVTAERSRLRLPEKNVRT